MSAEEDEERRKWYEMRIRAMRDQLASHKNTRRNLRRESSYLRRELPFIKRAVDLKEKIVTKASAKNEQLTNRMTVEIAMRTEGVQSMQHQLFEQSLVLDKALDLLFVRTRHKEVQCDLDDEAVDHDPALDKRNLKTMISVNKLTAKLANAECDDDEEVDVHEVKSNQEDLDDDYKVYIPDENSKRSSSMLDSKKLGSSTHKQCPACRQVFDCRKFSLKSGLVKTVYREFYEHCAKGCQMYRDAQEFREKCVECKLLFIDDRDYNRHKKEGDCVIKTLDEGPIPRLRAVPRRRFV